MTARDRILWFAIVAGPLAWFGDHSIGYAIVPPAHLWGRTTALIAVHLAATVVCVVAGLVGARELRSPHPRARFMAVAAVAFATISLLLVLGNSIVTLVLTPGAEP
jgi:hypothetical protein